VIQSFGSRCVSKIMTATTYELWHAASGNFLEDFESEAEALAAVREYLEANGPEMVEDLALGIVPSTGLTARAETPPFLRGAALLARIQAAAQSTAPPTAGVSESVEPTQQAGTRPKPASERPPGQIEPLKAAAQSLGDGEANAGRTRPTRRQQRPTG
jgi:hypothetical protein